MKQFPEIIRILDRFREKQIETIDASFKAKQRDKAYILYDGIRTGEFANDTSAAKALYDANPLDTRYTSLKSRLKARLINSVFHLNLKRAGFSDYAQAVYSGNRRSFIAQTLVGLGARSSGTRVAARNLEVAEKYHLTAVALAMGSLLRENSTVFAKTADYERYDTLVKKLSQVLNAELISMGLYERAQLFLSTKTGNTQEFGKTVEGYVQELHPLAVHVNSFTFKMNLFRLEQLAFNALGKHAERIAVCNEAEDYLSKNPHLSSNPRLAEFALIKLEGYIVVRDYENGNATAQKIATLLPVGSPNWFSFSMFHFLLLMHTSHFVEAEQLYDQVTSNERFTTLPDFWQERWKLFELYLNYALQTVPGYEGTIQKKFDLQNVLRFMPVAAKDKHGLYIAVLIIHILYMLEMKDFSGIIDRMDALRTYRNRYLKSAGNRRSAIFFKLLTVMENNSFSYKLVKAKSDRYYKQLLAAELEDAESDEELQVIPYEWLWDRILEKLEGYEKQFSVRL